MKVQNIGMIFIRKTINKNIFQKICFKLYINYYAVREKLEIFRPFIILIDLYNLAIFNILAVLNDLNIEISKLFTSKKNIENKTTIKSKFIPIIFYIFIIS